MTNWGNLHDRYAQPKAQRKILSLDGGGIRGLITLEILRKLETDLRKRLDASKAFRLSDFFDYIGGTSTGAIIAAGLAIGMSVDQLIEFYTVKGKSMFDKNFITKRWKSLYNSGPLEEILKDTFGSNTDIDISNGYFKSILLIVTMNRTTDSPWPISNNSLAKYNQQDRPDCNLRIPLYKLVRASTAAPTYFNPETIQNPKNSENEFAFVDGGMTPYNNPAFLMYRMATQSMYSLDWPTGENKLLIMSVGTGSAPSEGVYNNLLHAASSIPNNLMHAINVEQDINCRMIGRCTFGAPIDRELGSMIPMDEKGNMLPMDLDQGRQFTYVRYNADLSEDGLSEMGLNHIKSHEIREMDNVSQIKNLQEVGNVTANNQISLSHFENFI